MRTKGPDVAIAIAPAETPEDIAAAKALFIAYAESQNYHLCFAAFGKEMADFPAAYAPPTGTLLVARLDGAVVGTVALGKVGDGIGEMKRLYVRPTARGFGLGAALGQAVIARARDSGYRVLRLDTVPGAHDTAIALYERLGFQRVSQAADAIPGTIRMELPLR